MKVLSVSNLSYSYPATGAKVLDDVNLDVRSGDFVGIIGPNGAGKTTLCLTFNKIIPDILGGTLDGDIEIFGVNSKDTNISELSLKIGVIFQNPRHQLSGAGLTVKEEIAFGLQNLGMEKDHIYSKVLKVAQEVGLEKHLERSPFHLSGGEQQRLAIGTVLAMEPDMIILDEPFVMLDPVGVREVAALIGNMNTKMGKTVILVESNTEVLSWFATRVIILNKGKIVADGSTNEILTDVEMLQRNGVAPPQVSQLAYFLEKHGQWRGKYPLNEIDAYTMIKKQFYGR